LLQWGIIDGNDKTMFVRKIISYFRYGANRRQSIRYPNREIGYGDFDLLGTFNTISGVYRGKKEKQSSDSINENNSNKYDEFTEYYINKLFIRIPKRKHGGI